MTDVYITDGIYPLVRAYHVTLVTIQTTNERHDNVEACAKPTSSLFCMHTTSTSLEASLHELSSSHVVNLAI